MSSSIGHIALLRVHILPISLKPGMFGIELGSAEAAKGGKRRERENERVRDRLGAVAWAREWRIGLDKRRLVQR